MDVEEKNILTYNIEINNMTCNACETSVENSIYELGGIINAKVSYENKNAIVSFNKKKTSLKEIKIFIDKTGYKSSKSILIKD